MKRMVLAGLLALSAGCFVSAASVMDSYVGGTDRELAERWGAPNRSITLADGSRVLTYVESARCERSFTVSAAGRVMSWTALPDCPKEFRK